GTVQTPTTSTSLTDGATVSPGSSPGTLSVTGKYTQNSSGALNVDINGTSAGSFDQVNTTQAISLNGALNITTGGAYVPTEGDTFTILSTTAGGVTGTFSSLTGDDLGNGFYYHVVYNASNVQLVVKQVKISLSAPAPTNEGNTGGSTTPFNFTVTATNWPRDDGQSVSVHYATTD